MSDFAIPNFKSLKRLIFFHGRKFGASSVIYLSHCLFKGPLCFCGALVLNFFTGYSA
jgi:hypothetical protein